MTTSGKTFPTLIYGVVSTCVAKSMRGITTLKSVAISACMLQTHALVMSFLNVGIGYSENEFLCHKYHYIVTFYFKIIKQ